MPEDAPQSPTPDVPPNPTLADAKNPATGEPVPNAPIPFDIGEEYGTAKKNLPPAGIVLIVLAVAAVVIGMIVFAQRPHSATTGAIENIASADLPDQNILMAALNVSLQNRSDKKYWIKSIKADLETKDGHYTDDAASAIDFGRYFQAFPALKEHALAPLIPEIRIDPGAKASGTVIVSFPVTADAFANRKSLTLTIQPYDGVALVLSK